MKAEKANRWLFTNLTKSMEVEDSTHGVRITMKGWLAYPESVRVPRRFLGELIIALQEVNKATEYVEKEKT